MTVVGLLFVSTKMHVSVCIKNVCIKKKCVCVNILMYDNDSVRVSVFWICVCKLVGNKHIYVCVCVFVCVGGGLFEYVWVCECVCMEGGCVCVCWSRAPHPVNDLFDGV